MSLPFMDPDSLNDFGIVSILPWTYWVAVIIVSMGFAVSVVLPLQYNWLRIASLITLILLLHATPPIVYGTLRYSWAWKHIGIVDYIQRYGEVDRSITFLSAYHNWPGFFWLFARLSDWLNFGPIQIANAARFFSIFSNIVFVFLLRGIYRRFTTDKRLVYASLWIFVCTNWVGQDYFSPQALAYSLYLLILLLCLGPLMPGNDLAVTSFGRRIGRMRDRLSIIIPLDPVPSTQQRILAIIAVSFAMCAIAASHQLTPLMLVFSLSMLVIMTPLGIVYPIIAGLMLVYWALYPASPFTSVYLPDEVAQMGQTVEGVTGKLVDTSAVDLGVAVVAWAGRALSVGVVLLGVLGWLRRLRMGAKDGIICALLFAPTLMLGATSYGGEAIFRIFFFSLPFITFFCAGFFFPSARKGTGNLIILFFGILSILLIVGFLFGNNGKDRQYRFSPDEVAAAYWLYSRGGPETLLVEGARSYPSQFMNYENFTYLPIANESLSARVEILSDPAPTLDRWFSNDGWQDGYVILTRSQKAYVEALGIMSEGALDLLALALMASPDFLLVYANEDSQIFRSTRFAGPPDVIRNASE